MLNPGSQTEFYRSQPKLLTPMASNLRHGGHCGSGMAEQRLPMQARSTHVGEEVSVASQLFALLYKQ